MGEEKYSQGIWFPWEKKNIPKGFDSHGIW